ncbi:MAG: VWA-like domain-containing protein, partial [Actinomycetota bacterium]
MTEGLDRAKVAAARLWATNHYPYLASAVFASPTLPAPELGRLVIDRHWRVHADPAVVDRASVAELGGELLHLATHVLRDHAGRADGVGLGEPAELHHWVDAADAEIHDDFPPHLDRVEPSTSPGDLDCEDGRLAEEYYRRGSVRDGTATDCGSGAHGRIAGWEPPPPAPGEQGVADAEQDLLRRKVAADVARAAADEASASLRRWAHGVLEPTTDWRRVLAAALRHSLSSEAGAVDYSYQRPSRRAASSPGVVLASLRRPAVEVAVVCDTSASVDDEQLGLAVAEIDGVLRAVGNRSTTVISCDSAVRTVTRATRGRDVTLGGGGGTDMGIGIETALEARPAPGGSGHGADRTVAGDHGCRPV